MTERVAPARGRWAGSTIFAVPAVAGFAVLSGIYLGAGLLFADETVRFLVSDLAFLIPITAVVVTGAMAYRRSRGAEARFWLLLTGANAVILTSELYYVWWRVSLGYPEPVYAPFQLLHLAAGCFFISLLLSMTKFSSMTRVQQGRLLLDSAALVTMLYVFILRFVIDPLFAGVPNVTTPDYIAGAAYPIFGVVVVAGTLAIMLGFKVTGWLTWEKFVALSLVIYACGISVWPVWLVSFREGGPSMGTSALDLILVLGHYLLLLATAYRLTRREQEWPLRPTPLFQPTRGRRLAYAVPLLTLMALPVIVYGAVQAGDGSRDRWVMTGAALLLAGIAVARTTLVAVENGRLFHRAITDPLTGLFNHRFLHERLLVEIDIAQRYGEGLCLVDLDVDDLDRVNNVYGHPAGDDTLVAVGQAVRVACGPAAAVCRVGGDQFSVIMPNTAKHEALQVALRVQHGVRVVLTPAGDPVTVSMGIASYPADAADAEQLVALAQGTVYWAKRHGKDQVLVYDPAVVTELGPDERIRTIEEQTHIGTVRALATAVDARDPATRHHSRSVAALAVQVGAELGLGADRVRMLETAALLHDVGMIGISDDILRKPGALTDEERAHVHEHPGLGEQILGSTNLDGVLPWIRHHHERWDGLGYPDGLRAVAIPLEARILAVCDAFEAMTSDRPYRPAKSRAQAIEELVAGKETQFDPAVVDVFLTVIGHVPGSA